MKSLHVIASKTMGGAERWFVRFLQAMQRRGHEVHAAVRPGSDLALHHLQDVPCATVPMRTGWDPLSRWEMSRHAARVDAPIVQTYMTRATRVTHLKPDAGRVHIARLGGYYKLARFRHAHAWVGNTRALCDWMVQEGLPHQRVFHIYNFIDSPRLAEPKDMQALRTALKLSASDFVLLAAGRFVDFKGHAVLLDALARVPVEIGGRRVRVLLLGDGPLGEALHRQAHTLGIEERLVWCGWQQDPAPYYQIADLVVFPSREREPFGNVILDAWSFGKPLVVTAFRGAREVVRHGQDGYMVACEDPGALAKGIQAVAGDASLRTALAAAGRNRVERDFSEPVIVGQYTDLYTKLAS